MLPQLTPAGWASISPWRRAPWPDVDILDPALLIEELGLPYFRELATFGALSDDAILMLLRQGQLWKLTAGEKLIRLNQAAEDFQVVLTGRIAFYKRGEDTEVFTRHFCAGDQTGFDLMIGMIEHNGTDVAEQDSVLLSIDKALFYRMHLDFPADFGLLMINLARELSREIELLEDALVGQGT